VPIYEYACQKCGHQFDVLQKVSDRALRKCPECGALRLKKLVSAPQFRLKGTGWYETDFKQDKKKRLADAGEAKPAAEAAPADKDAKPAKAEPAEKAQPVKPKKAAPGKAASAAD
jgi:putative FmdB family regulatory protein